MNRIDLTATLTERSAMRYTPAGVAVTQAVFHHEGEVVEAGALRNIQMDVDTIALGALAQRVQALPLGAQVRFTGFLAPRSRRSQKLRVHMTDFDLGA